MNRVLWEWTEETVSGQFQIRHIDPLCRAGTIRDGWQHINDLQPAVVAFLHMARRMNLNIGFSLSYGC